MSQESRGTGGQKLAGSVRAARQRVEAGLPLQYPPISRPQLRPQWPLSNDNGESATRHDGRELQQEEYVNHKGPPPKRPPRPSYVPSILDASKVQGYTPVQYGQVQESERPQIKSQQSRYWEADFATSPHDPSTPGTGISSSSSGRLSTSSVGSIPDFPAPAMPPSMTVPTQPRRSANIGPPPSARRGASSYYSQSSYVAPIPEEAFEAPKRSKNDSYASSNAIPRNWTDGLPGYYTDRITTHEDDHTELDDRGIVEQDEPTGLVRQASLGKQYKPSLTTVRSTGISSSEGLSQSYKKVRGVAKPVRNVGAVSVAASGASNAKVHNTMEDEAQPGLTAFLDPPSEDSTEDLVIMHVLDEPESQRTPQVQKTWNPRDPASNPRDLAVGNGATVHPLTFDEMARSTPQAGIDGARRAESRASLTSLPDLIRRATRVAANLDRGRTASRLGMLEMFNSSNPNLLDKAAPNQARHSISDMLTSFPLPTANSPTGSNERPVSRWPSPFINSNSNLRLAQSVTNDPKQESLKRRKGGRRRCCGLPVWAFALILILLVLLVAAAVVIPIVLIVLPRQNQTSTGLDLSNCASSHPCNNSGISIVSSSSCGCVCVNGFTGLSCSNPDDSVSGCTVVNIDSFQKATAGTSIPRLLTASSSNFSIPLNASSILSAFSADSLSCSDENNLVTFSGKAQRRRSLPEPVDLLHVPRAMTTFAPRAPMAQDGGQAVTSNGIIVAAPTPTASTQPTLSGASPSATASSSSETPGQRDVDFARVAVLYILQQTALSTAVDAQQKLQVQLTPGAFVSSKVSISPSISVDFSDYQVMVQGTVVGGQLS